MIEYRSLYQEELDSWFDHCMYSFGNEKNSEGYREHFKRHWYNDPNRDINGILVAVEGGAILSSLRIFYRDMYIEGKKIRAAGIGEVGTRLESRGKGLSASLLEIAVTQMEQSCIHVCMLGAIKRDFYARFGWQQNRMVLKVCKTDAALKLPYNIRPVDFESDMEALERIHTLYSGGFNGTFARDTEYWRIWIKPQFKSCWVAEDGRYGIIAYICMEEGEDQAIVKEFGCIPSFESVFDAFTAKGCCLLGKPGCDVKFPSGIKAELNLIRAEEWPYNMLRLIIPFKVGNTNIEATKQLLEVLNGGENISTEGKYLYWHTDSF